MVQNVSYSQMLKKITKIKCTKSKIHNFGKRQGISQYKMDPYWPNENSKNISLKNLAGLKETKNLK